MGLKSCPGEGYNWEQAQVSVKKEGSPMLSLNEFASSGAELERLLVLPTSPIAVKMIETENDIPPEAFRPRRDKGEHYAQCQAFALSRRDRLTVAMLKDDNWCPAPVLTYGLVPFPEERKDDPSASYDRFEYGKYIGILTAPLATAAFVPDVVLIYCDTNQLRKMLLALPEGERPRIRTNLFPFSCAFSVTSPILKGEYWVNLPDPGEYVRALTQAGEMIFSIPAVRMGSFMDYFRRFDKDSLYAHEQMMIKPNFPQIELYKTIFSGWGMDHSD
jgi:uncharacterized protein (DUF169 family)